MIALLSWLQWWVDFWRGMDWWLALLGFVVLAVLIERSAWRFYFLLAWWRARRRRRRFGEQPPACPLCGRKDEWG